jgi:hypothetical protein
MTTNHDRNLDADSNSNLESRHNPDWRREDINREGGRRHRDFYSHPTPPSPDVIKNGPRGDSIRHHKRDEYFGSPYDVGNYASHYDEGTYNPKNQMAAYGPNDRKSLSEINFTGKGPRSYKRSDKRVLEDVNDRLYLDPYIDASDIEVDIADGDVTLKGTVKDRGAKKRAEDIAENIPGVKNIENRLRIAKERTSS